MDAQDATRINGAFNEMMKKQREDRESILKLQKAIAEQQNQIHSLQNQISSFVQRFFNGNATA